MSTPTAELLALSELLDAARVYALRYVQDEAMEDGDEITGCSRQQHLDAVRLMEAIADASPYETFLSRPSLSAQAVGWIYEDELPDGYPYDAMFPYSKVDGVRMFPVFAPEHAFRAGYQSGYSAGCDRPNGYAREADISNEWSEYVKENCNG